MKKIIFILIFLSLPLSSHAVQCNAGQTCHAQQWDSDYMECYDWTLFMPSGGSCTGDINCEYANFCTGGSSTCTSWTYSSWGVCQTNNTESRTVLTSSPDGCTGGSPVLSQACVYVPPSCTYEYTEWLVCDDSETQSRTVISSSPSGCSGTPLVIQSCIDSNSTVTVVISGITTSNLYVLTSAYDVASIWSYASGLLVAVTMCYLVYKLIT